MHLYEYKLQRCFYKGTIVYIFQNVFCVCCMYNNGYIHILLYSVLFYYTVHVSGIKYKSNSKQTIAKKLCIELN